MSCSNTSATTACGTPSEQCVQVPAAMEAYWLGCHKAIKETLGAPQKVFSGEGMAYLQVPIIMEFLEDGHSSARPTPREASSASGCADAYNLRPDGTIKECRVYSSSTSAGDRNAGRAKWFQRNTAKPSAAPKDKEQLSSTAITIREVTFIHPFKGTFHGKDALVTFWNAGKNAGHAGIHEILPFQERCCAGRQGSHGTGYRMALFSRDTDYLVRAQRRCVRGQMRPPSTISRTGISFGCSCTSILSRRHRAQPVHP